MTRWPYLAPSPEPTQPKSVEPLAQCSPPAKQPTLPQALWWPRPDDRPVRPDWMAVQGVGHRSSCQAAQAASVALLAFKIQQPGHPQLPPERFHQVSAQAQTPWQKTPPFEARQGLWPSRCGREQRSTSPPTSDSSPAEH
jgi:hypothetical protein